MIGESAHRSPVQVTRGRTGVVSAMALVGCLCGVRRVEHRSTRETILGCPTPFAFGFFERVGILRFGFSLANLSLGLVRHHRSALHYPFHVVQSSLISTLTREKV
jgi:hypothetical protein